MSSKYDEYLEQHIANVNKAAEWLCDHFPDVEKVLRDPACQQIFPTHDNSKFEPAEYYAYDDYFYGNRSYAVVQAFKLAWLHHIHQNPHHWQYWILQNDDEGEELLSMPHYFIYEMICDWWSFSFKSGNLYEIFSWYENHRHMKLAQDTRKFVEHTLDRIRAELDKEQEAKAS